MKVRIECGSTRSVSHGNINSFYGQPARIAFLQGIVEELPGLLEPVQSWLAKLADMPFEEKERQMKQADSFVRAMLRMGNEELAEFISSEFISGTL